MTTILGLVVGRSRSALTIIRSIPHLSGTYDCSESPRKPISAKSVLVSHRNLRFEELPNFLLDELNRHVVDSDQSTGFAHSALLNCVYGRVSDKNIHELKLQAIIEHELRKQFLKSPLEVSIQQLRQSVGLKSQSSSTARRDLIHRFQQSGTVFEDPQTVSGLQILSESWGVAQYLNKKIQLDELKTDSPDLVSQIRSDIMSSRKLFASPTYSDPEVIKELLEQEVDKRLAKRFQ